MDRDALLGLTGLIATIIFGAASVYLVVRKRYPASLAFILEREIALFDDLVKNLPELTVQFDNAPVTENLVLGRFYILNTGDRDIAPPMVHKKLEARLPEGHRWRTAKIVAAPRDAAVTATIESPVSLILDLGLFRREEYVAVEAVAEVPETGEGPRLRRRPLRNAISFDHRIVDTAPVKTVPLPQPMTKRRRLIAAVILPSYLAALLALPLVLLLVVKPGQFRYRLERSGSPASEFTMEPRADGTVQLRNLDTKAAQNLTLDQVARLGLERHIVPLAIWKDMVYPIAAVLLLLLLFYTAILVAWKRGRKLRRLIRLPMSDDRGRVA